MRHSFRYTLLITWLLLLVSCGSRVVKTGFEAENIAVSQQINAVDSTIIELYQPYKAIVDKDMNRVISESEVNMEKDKPESLLTNFLGDLLLHEATVVAQKQALDIVPDVSFFNYGGIRSSLSKGEITVGKIFELMPFENKLVLVQLKGDKMKAFLDYVAGHGGDSLGGTRFTISNEEATNITIGGQAFDSKKTYWLATNDYVAAGGDGLSMLQNNLRFIDTNELIRDLIISYFERMQKQNKKITAKLDGRISNE